MKKPEKGTSIGLSKATNEFISNTAKYLQIEIEETVKDEEIIKNYEQIQEELDNLKTKKSNIKI
jgi:hypothetical protein